MITMSQSTRASILFSILQQELDKKGLLHYGDVDIARYGGVTFYTLPNRNDIGYLAIANITDSFTLGEIPLLNSLNIPDNLREEDVENLYLIQKRESSLSVYELEDILDTVENEFHYYSPFPFEEASYSEILSVLTRYLENNLGTEPVEIWDPELLVEAYPCLETSL